MGAYVDDIDGNRYLDALGNYTSLVLGHCHPAVVDAVRGQLELGTAWAAGTESERELAGLIVERLQSVDQVCFTASGTEATLMAIRAARAFTGRPLIAKFEGAYHGLHDYAVVPGTSTSPGEQEGESSRSVTPEGVPAEVAATVIRLPFNDLSSVESIVAHFAKDLAALIVEPVMGVAGVIAPQPEFLVGLRELTQQYKVILIFDEVISFRLGYGGAQEVYSVSADLTTLGKVIGGGLPVGAVGGRREIMKIFDPSISGGLLLSGTYHANPVTLAAGCATLRVLTRSTISDLNDLGARLSARLSEVAMAGPEHARVNAIGSLFNFHFNDQEVVDHLTASRDDRTILPWLHLALLNEGVMIAPRGMGCLSVPMTDADVELFVGAVEQAFAALRDEP